MSLPSRHLDAARLGLAVGALLILATLTLCWHYGVEVDGGTVFAAVGAFLSSYLLAVGGSAYARHNGAREPSGGVTQEAPTRPQEAPEP